MIGVIRCSWLTGMPTVLMMSRMIVTTTYVSNAPSSTARLPSLIAILRPACMNSAHLRFRDLDLLTPVRQRHLDGVARAGFHLGLHQLVIAVLLDPDGGRQRLGCIHRRRELVQRVGGDLSGDADSVLATDRFAAVGLGVGEIG